MTYAVARVRLRIRNVTRFARKPCSLRATGVSLNGMHIYGDTGRNTRLRLRGRRRVVNRGREKGDDGAKEKERGWKRDRRLLTQTHPPGCVSLAALSAVTNLNGAFRTRLLARAF